MPELETDDRRNAKRDQTQSTIQDWLNTERFRRGMARILPRHLDSERFHTLMIRQVATNEDLKLCTPISLVGAMMEAATLGLEPGIGGECWLIPYENSFKDRDGKWHKRLEAALQIGYLGHLQLAYRSEKVAAIQCDYVMKSDHFRHQRGTSGLLEHVPADDRPTDPEQMTHAYGLIETVHGGHIWWVLTRQEVERIRQRAPSKNSPAWRDWYMEMAMAKALKRALKFAPRVRDAGRAIQIDDEHDAGVPQSFNLDLPTDLLPEHTTRSEAERQAQEMVDRARAQRETRNAATAPADDGADVGEGEPIPPTQDRRQPVMAAKERGRGNGRGNGRGQAKRATQPPPEDEEPPEDLPPEEPPADDGDAGPLGWG